MQNTQNLDGIVFDSVGQDKGGAAYDQLACARNTACPAGAGVLGEKSGGLPNTLSHFMGGCRIVSRDKTDGLFKIDPGQPNPPNFHPCPTWPGPFSSVFQ